MRHHRMLAVLLLVVLYAAASHAAVSVSFVEPERDTDLGDLNRDARLTLLEIARHLEALGNRYLSAQDSLRIEVLDVKLAGRSHIARETGWSVRVMTGDADWPRIELRYVLESGGAPREAAREVIVDRNYLRRIDRDYPYSSPIPQEKRMLDEWFRARFISPHRRSSPAPSAPRE